MLKTKTIVSVSDAKVSNDPADLLATYSLGSCIGVCLYDSATHIGGLLHYQLPDSKIDPERAQQKPFMFADTGLKIVLEHLFQWGGNKTRMSGSYARFGLCGLCVFVMLSAHGKIPWTVSCVELLRAACAVFG